MMQALTIALSVVFTLVGIGQLSGPDLSSLDVIGKIAPCRLGQERSFSESNLATKSSLTIGKIVLMVNMFCAFQETISEREMCMSSHLHARVF